ncbi:MAG TPA: MauE/DoxX family redox-associated membrane protein [Streptosporangiaceae bacterium]|nr:MauE/DoxX family redox-associated membrane protein [Streptosporangiaceae bacterium]
MTSSGYLVLAAVFGLSGVTKLRHPRALAGQVENYEIVPRALAAHVGAALAVTEAGCALLLLLPATRLAALVIASGLIATFLAAMSLTLARGRRIPCACFGGQGQLDMVGLPSLLRTVLLGIIVTMSLDAQPAGAQPAGARPAQLLVAALLLVLVFLLAETSRLLSLRPAGVSR